jgi:hypothetical protein
MTGGKERAVRVEDDWRREGESCQSRGVQERAVKVEECRREL